MSATYFIQLVNMKNGSVCGHKAGCSDLKKLATSGHAVLDVHEVASKAESWYDYSADFINEGGVDSAYEIEWKACASHIPAGDKSAFLEDEKLTRKQCLAVLAALNYTGPTSYLMPKLRAIVAAQRTTI